MDTKKVTKLALSLDFAYLLLLPLLLHQVFKLAATFLINIFDGMQLCQAMYSSA